MPLQELEKEVINTVAESKSPNVGRARVAGRLGRGRAAGHRAGPRRAAAGPRGALAPAAHAPGRRGPASRDPTNFRGLVLGCIEAKFCK